jgi:peptidoglycan glycosyltransferase
MSSLAGRFPDRPACPPAELALLAIGQGRGLVTPLHMALLAAAVASDGTPWAPRLKASVPPARLEPFFGASTSRRLRSMMRDAVVNGTGRSANVPGLSVAGKTGTAQTPRGDDHSWFVCLAPVEAPRIVLAVVVEHGGSGSSAAAPAAAAILRAADRLGMVRPPAGGPTP